MPRTETLGNDEVRRRWEESQDLIRQNGVTYNVYGDPRGMNRPWQLDPIPLLISVDAIALKTKAMGARVPFRRTPAVETDPA